MPKRYHFEAEQWLPYPLETVFLFFADPANLPRLMPEWQRARIESATYIPPQQPHPAFPGSERVFAGTGTRLRLTARPFPLAPVRLPWNALIEDFQWLRGFCDVQEKGPFTYWRHCHSLTSEVRNGIAGTRLQDAVEYTPPFGVLGRLANVVFLRRGLKAAFDLRHKRALELLANR
jgi:ligand-binding SRPBCC domain-containing protein